MTNNGNIKGFERDIDAETLALWNRYKDVINEVTTTTRTKAIKILQSKVQEHESFIAGLRESGVRALGGIMKVLKG